MTEAEIEAAARAPKHAVACAGSGARTAKWAIYITGGLTGPLTTVEIFEGTLQDAYKRCAFHDAKAALAAAERVRWGPVPSAEIIAAFKAEPLESWGAPADDWTCYSFEWNFRNGAKLWFDIDICGTLSILWRAEKTAKPYTLIIGQPFPSPPESKSK